LLKVNPNKLIDQLIHPIARKDPRFWLLDFGLHCLIERNVRQSLGKAAKYYGPKIGEELAKEIGKHLNTVAEKYQRHHDKV